jgi:hypothetical protein
MKRPALRSSLQPLGLGILAQHPIITVREGGAGRRRYAQFEPVPNDVTTESDLEKLKLRVADLSEKAKTGL